MGLPEFTIGEIVGTVVWTTLLYVMGIATEQTC